MIPNRKDFGIEPWLIMACALVGGCECQEQQVNNPITMEQTLENANADCSVKVTLSAREALSVECVIAVKNRTDRDLYLFNRAYSELTPEGRPAFDKNVFYSYLDDRERLVMSKAIDALQPGLNVEYMVYPACTKIAPGGTTEDRLTIALPIQLYAPYTPKRKPSPGSRPVVMFRFGYFIGHEGTAAMEIKLPSKDGEVIHFDPFDPDFQKIIEVGTFEPMPVAE
jgi:hypothetical protein